MTTLADETLADAAVRILNEAFAADPAAMAAITTLRIPANAELAAHPVIEVEQHPKFPPDCYFVGLMGLLNGVLGDQLGSKRIQCKWEVVNPRTTRLAGFELATIS